MRFGEVGRGGNGGRTRMRMVGAHDLASFGARPLQRRKVIRRIDQEPDRAGLEVPGGNRLVDDPVARGQEAAALARRVPARVIDDRVDDAAQDSMRDSTTDRIRPRRARRDGP